MGPKPFAYLLLYFPIALVTSFVLTAAKEDSPREIVRKGLKTFGLLSLAILGGGVLVYMVGSIV
ncbi:MAG: hypothetical protein HUU15_07215 [Candidatus Brocadiae bacterium]|nr:hypothetical protein [Candidatus Brocadiia bacterium]